MNSFKTLIKAQYKREEGEAKSKEVSKSSHRQPLFDSVVLLIPLYLMDVY